MRKLALLVTLMVASALFLGAAPGAASAANCTPSAGSLKNQAGAVRFVAALSNCTGVSDVRFVRDNAPYTPTGFWDGTYSGWMPGGLNAPYPQGATTVTINISGTSGASIYVLANCWYTGTHGLNPYFLYQIKNSAPPYYWGPLHDYLGGAGYVPC